MKKLFIALFILISSPIYSSENTDKKDKQDSSNQVLQKELDKCIERAYFKKFLDSKKNQKSEDSNKAELKLKKDIMKCKSVFQLASFYAE